jgi:hypothetical protein
MTFEVVAYAGFVFLKVTIDAFGKQCTYIFIFGKRDMRTIVPRKAIPDITVDVAAIVDASFVDDTLFVAEMEGGTKTCYSRAEDGNLGHRCDPLPRTG